jgi:molybdenum cofactor cytidylyltransferase
MSSPATIGVLLAAGVSRRMGTQKLLLPWPPDSTTPMVLAARNCIVDACVHMVIVVSPTTRNDVRTALASSAVTFTEVADAQPMFASIQAGLRAAHAIDPTASCLLHLGDVPGVRPGTVTRIQAASNDHPAKVIIPTCEGKGGHPTLLPSDLHEAMLAYDGRGGLRAWLEAHAEHCHRLTADDPGVLRDIDTPDDYGRPTSPEDRPAGEPTGVPSSADED